MDIDIFLIPTALVSAELASNTHMQGGIYGWVKQAFGKHIGFFAIWLQWIENVIWYPTILSFVAGTVGYLINPTLINNPFFLWAVIIIAFWGAFLPGFGSGSGMSGQMMWAGPVCLGEPGWLSGGKKV